MWSRTVLSNMIVTSHMWLFTFKDKLGKIKFNKKFSFSVTVVIFQVLNSHICLVATMLGGANTKHSIIAKFPLHGTCLEAKPRRYSKAHLKAWESLTISQNSRMSFFFSIYLLHFQIQNNELVFYSNINSAATLCLWLYYYSF